MSPVPVSPRRVFGVDFSAAQDAGRHIWICRAHPGSDGIRLESVDPIAKLPGGAVPRDDAFRALVQKVVESPRSAWGFDFSFALPEGVAAAIAPAGSDYTQRVDAVAACADAGALRARCREAAPGAELRRKTDVESSTPFSPYNLRIFRQTYHGIADVLRPLRARSEVAVLPFDRLPESRERADARLPFHHAASGTVPHVYLMEVCPASVLAKLGYSTRGYKGAGDDRRARRRGILAALVDDGLVRPTARALRERILGDSAGDAVDSVLAAVGAWRGYRDYDHAALRADPHYGVEGFVYA